MAEEFMKRGRLGEETRRWPLPSWTARKSRSSPVNQAL